MRFTVFTPAYNRADLLPRLYRSLKEQSFRDFEWVVVDDGSTDGTEELIKGYIEEEPFFPIVYKKVENGGKPRAVNLGVTMASGELFMTVDSDDYLTPDSLERSDEIERSIPEAVKSSFAGVCGLKGFADGQRIGRSFEGEYLDCTNLERIKNRIFGDKSEVIYTEVFRKYPLPVFEGEKFITECVVFDRMAADGLTFRYFNTVTTVCEYRSDGLSGQGKALFLNNPLGYGLHLYECGKYGRHNFETKWRTYVNYVEEMRGILDAAAVARALHMSTLAVRFIDVAARIYRKIKRRKDI